MLIVGDKEMEDQTVSVRKHGEGDLGTLSVEDFVKKVDKIVEEELAI
jgi:threonyl-tRNA synthetase